MNVRKAIKVSIASAVAVGAVFFFLESGDSPDEVAAPTTTTLPFEELDPRLVALSAEHDEEYAALEAQIADEKRAAEIVSQLGEMQILREELIIELEGLGVDIPDPDELDAVLEDPEPVTTTSLVPVPSTTTVAPEPEPPPTTTVPPTTTTVPPTTTTTTVVPEVDSDVAEFAAWYDSLSEDERLNVDRYFEGSR